jgi:hypothetical protein
MIPDDCLLGTGVACQANAKFQQLERLTAVGVKVGDSAFVGVTEGRVVLVIVGVGLALVEVSK